MNPEEPKPAEPVPPAASEPPKPTAEKPDTQKTHWLRWIILVVVIGVAIFFGIPYIRETLNTVSTDDAYVNSYVTFVAPRVTGQVARVLVDDNNRVKKGDVLVELDPEPFHVQVAIKQAAVDSAQSDLVVAKAGVRAAVALARSQRFKLLHAIEETDNQIAVLRARVATLEQSKASLVLAQSEYNRMNQLLSSKAVSIQEVEQKREALDVAQAQVTQAIESVYQARASLGLPATPPAGKGLADVPVDLDQTFSTVRQGVADLIHSASPLGITASSYNLTPKELLEEFYKRDPGGDIDKIYADIIKNAPALKQAEAALMKTQRDLESAQLDLRYCTVVAEIDGVITRRNVNPGDHVQVGQSLMALRSLKDIWVDANFKETQLRSLRIGQRVELDVDMYGSKRAFEGRISGFTMGTGSTLALLPAQNATGNFVKVVQRLPVRIDVVDYDPEKFPLFVGLSVTPTVDIVSAPAGPDAGKFLQEVITTTAAPVPVSPAPIAPKP